MKREIRIRYRDVWEVSLEDRILLVGHRHAYIPKHIQINRGEGGKAE